METEAERLARVEDELRDERRRRQALERDLRRIGHDPAADLERLTAYDLAAELHEAARRAAGGDAERAWRLAQGG